VAQLSLVRPVIQSSPAAGRYVLFEDGALIPGTSRNVRPRVPSLASARQRTRAEAARVLSSVLADRRRAADLTQQPQLAEITGMSMTTIGHAKTGRLWQSHRIWERVDKGLNAEGELLRLHDAYLAAEALRDPAVIADEACETTATALASVMRITISWANGDLTTVYPPQRKRAPKLCATTRERRRFQCFAVLMVVETSDVRSHVRVGLTQKQIVGAARSRVGRP
jgi:hypothetical protein